MSNENLTITPSNMIHPMPLVVPPRHGVRWLHRQQVNQLLDWELDDEDYRAFHTVWYHGFHPNSQDALFGDHVQRVWIDHGRSISMGWVLRGYVITQNGNGF